MKTVLLFLLISPTILWAQLTKVSPQDLQRKQSYLLMRDGSVLRGQIVRQDSSIISVRRRNGDMSFVEADQVVRISPNRPDVPVGATQSGSATPATIFVLRDGSQVDGTFVRRDSTMITVRKRSGQLTYFEPELLARVDTVQTQEGNSSVAGSADGAFPNRFSPWLLTGQTAFNPEKGRLYYRGTVTMPSPSDVTFAQLNEFAYGITRHWSAGIRLQPRINDRNVFGRGERNFLAVNTLFFSKLTFAVGEQFRFGLNAVYQPRQQRNNFSSIQQVTVQGLMSFGNSQRNATLGYGQMFFPDYASFPKQTFITAGVMHTIARNLTFLSDNTFYLNPAFGGSSADLSVALRFNRRRHAFDLGALATVKPRYTFYGGYPTPSGYETQAYFSPYIAYNLIIGRN